MEEDQASTSRDCNLLGDRLGGDKSVNTRRRRVSVIGACVHEGQDWYTGVESAPKAFRDAGLLKVISSLGYEVDDGGDVHVDNSVRASVCSEDFYQPGQIQKVELVGDTCGRLYNRVLDHCKKSDFVLTLGGDHSVAVGTISALKQFKKNISVIWVDAHADCNTPLSSPSGNFHGMPLGMLLGWFEKRADRFEWIEEYLKDPLPENRVAYIGLRDIDATERALLLKSNLIIYTMHEVEKLGIARVMDLILEKFGDETSIHLSFDIDGIDPIFAPGTGTRARGGLNYREARYICTALSATGRLDSMDLVEVNPSLDEPNKATSDHGDNANVTPNAPLTVKLGIDLVEFALGKTLI